MQTIKYLKELGINSLSESLGIIVKEYDDLYVLNYSQIESPKQHPVVMECRGLIIDKQFNVVSRAFDRFFNFGECPEFQDHLNFNRAVCYEKVDGSLIKIYFYDGMWHASTRGTAYAEASTPFGITFKELVLKSLDVGTEGEFQDLCQTNLDEEWTYIFEVTSVENRIVTRYEGYTLHFLAARHNLTGEYGDEYEKYQALLLGAREIKKYYFDSVEHCIDTAHSLPNLEEGWVIWQDNQPVCKVKSPAYLAVHAIRGEGLTPKRIMQLVLINEQDEYLTYFPEDREWFTPYENALENLLDKIKNVWEEYKHIEDKKEFALNVKDFYFSNVLFQAKGKGGCPVHIFHSLRESQKMKMLERELEND